MKNFFTLGFLFCVSISLNAQCFISEIHYDNSGTDVGEAVEITCPNATDISGYQIVHYNGSGGGIISTHTVPASTMIADQGNVICTGSPVASGTYFTAITPLQNDNEGLALVDAAGVVIEFISYEGLVTATAGPANGTTSVNIGVVEGSSTPAGFSLSKGCSGWFAPSANSFGSINAPLPVTFSNFDVENKGKSNDLSFTTLSEVNNDYFTIERSADGRTFEDIAKIAGAGNSSEELNYQYTDNTPENGINYYRVRQTDYDGTTAYSEIKSVTVGSKDAFAVNPRSTYRSLDISTDALDYQANLYNVSGQLVKSFAQLSANQTIDIDDMTSGIYYLHITHGGNVETFKVSKL